MNDAQREILKKSANYKKNCLRDTEQNIRQVEEILEKRRADRDRLILQIAEIEPDA